MARQLVSVASGDLRRRHYVYNANTGLYERTTLIEPARTQLIQDNTDLSTWSTNGTPTVTGGQSDPFGGTDGWLIEDDDGAVTEYIYDTVSFTGDAKKAVAVWIKAGTAAQSAIGLYNNTGGAYVMLATVTWSGTDPGTPSMSQGTFLYAERGPDDWWRLWFDTDSLTASDTHYLRLIPTQASAAATGTTYYAFPQAEDAVFPSSTILSSGAGGSRNADVLYVPHRPAPQESTIYLRFFERGAILSGSALRLLQIGLTNGTTDPRLLVIAAAAGYRLNHDNGTTTATATLGATPSVGDLVEIRAVLNADGSVTIGQSINGAAETTADDATTATLASAWAGERLYIGCDPAGSNGAAMALTHLLARPEVKTMAEMRALAA